MMTLTNYNYSKIDILHGGDYIANITHSGVMHHKEGVFHQGVAETRQWVVVKHYVLILSHTLTHRLC